ncbi:hypothetical protein [Mycobacteroides abscessus]
MIQYWKTTHGKFRQSIDYSDDQGHADETLHVLRIFGVLIAW